MTFNTSESEPNPRSAGHLFNSVAVEVAVANIADAVAAIEIGADRIELSQALELGGLTPSAALTLQVCREVQAEVWVLIRPRGAGFQYTTSERELILDDACRAIDSGAAGIVTGALDHQRQLDLDLWHRLISKVDASRCVMHRAIDCVVDRAIALEQLIDCGTRRVLTSGGAVSAWLGRSQLQQLVDQSRGRIEVLPAAGIDAENVVQLLLETGCRQVHGTFRSLATDPAEPVALSTYPRLDPIRLQQLITVLQTEENTF